ncbi:DUF7507 domain-containing protein [Nonlabens ponticola]|uniref:DUF7507 domain-containing protein n=1 Tax=Nonlabens ponticola TaxID=2496866 RepID=A0A3S9N1C8_9FLAO|nr:hypothetical protein EJ995_13060 [Nonlabens ponticola]
MDYDFTVTNTGDTALNNITVSDPLLVAPNGSITGSPIADLAPGTSVTITGSLTLTQADIDRGFVNNQATATGTTDDGDDVSDVSDDDSNLEDDTTTTPLPQDNSIAIIKEGTFNDANADGFAQVGETIDYDFTVTNTGDTALNNITVSDPLLVAPNGSITGSPIADLAPGASVTITGSLTLTQADIDRGFVNNQATATGTTDDGDDVSDVSDDDSNLEDDTTTTPLPQDNSIAIIKEGTFNDANRDGFAQVGETIDYDFTEPIPETRRSTTSR